MRKLASIKPIDEIIPIDGADNIVLVRIGGWRAVVQKAAGYVPGQLVVYMETDSILPSDNPEFAFMEPRKYRVKTIKLKGQISQGLVFPLSILPPKKFQKTEDVINDLGVWQPGWDEATISLLNEVQRSSERVESIGQGDQWQEGDDVTEVLGVKKYDPDEYVHTPGGPSAKRASTFPSFIPKTDEERVQNLKGLLIRNEGKRAYKTVKMDGSSATYYIRDVGTPEERFGVCSRNHELSYDRENPVGHFCQIAKEQNIEDKLRQFCSDYGHQSVAVQGELCGPGIQKNLAKLEKNDLFVFRLYLIDEVRYFSGERVAKFCQEYGMRMVPVLDWNHIIHTDVDLYVSDVYKMRHESYNGQQIEGVVYGTLDGVDDLQHGRVSFKVINNDYLLKNEE